MTVIIQAPLLEIGHLLPVIFTSLSSAMLQMASNIVLSSVMQSNTLLLFGICLHDYGLSFRNMPTSDKFGLDDHQQGYSDNDKEYGVEATGM